MKYSVCNSVQYGNAHKTSLNVIPLKIHDESSQYVKVSLYSVSSSMFLVKLVRFQNSINQFASSNLVKNQNFKNETNRIKKPAKEQGISINQIQAKNHQKSQRQKVYHDIDRSSRKLDFFSFISKSSPSCPCTRKQNRIYKHRPKDLPVI